MGLVIGGISAALGLGGGVLIVPLLPVIVDLTQEQTIATSLFTIFFVVAVNGYSFHKKNLVVWKVALTIGPLSAVGAFSAGWATQFLDDKTLKLILGTIILLMATRILLQKTKITGGQFKTSEPIWYRDGVIGLFSGLVSGISGVGAGMIMSPLILYFKLVTNEKMSPTSNGIMLFTTFFGALAFINRGQAGEGFSLGLIRADIAAVLVLCAWVTSYFGRPLQHKISFTQRRYMLGGLLLVLALKVLYEVSGL